MKNRIPLISAILILCFAFSVEAQVKNVQTEAEKQGTRRINTKIDKGIDSGLDAIEDGIGSLFGKKKKKKKGQAEQVNTSLENNSQMPADNSSEQPATQVQAMNVEWAKFDFVPGDEVIFEDAPSADEENGEFPSRWDLEAGQVEIANVNGEQVLMFLDGGEIVPYLKNSDKDYLPEVFTIEFDFYRPAGGNRIFIYLTDQKNQRGKGVYKDPQDFEITPQRVSAPGDITAEHAGRDYTYGKNGCWNHVSLAFTRGKLKVYLDDTRVINIPHYEFNPTGFTFYPYFADAGENKAFYAKNFRIAKGGVKYYDRVLSDGKIIVNGIRFDVNKATIKPESNGAINKIFQLMQKQPDLNFSVEGHTDSDGDEAKNQSLSEQRAKAVKDRLIDMGISANRLKSTGWGESKPIGENGTAEGKANNRRVEFVKFTGSSASAGSSSSNQGSSAFDGLNKKSIAAKLEGLPDQINIPISNNNGIENGPGTIVLYATSDGNFGKMEILDVDINDGYKLTTRYVTYNYDGSVYSQSNNLEVEGTYTCDLDKGKVGGDVQSEQDFHFGKQDNKTTTIYPGETAILRVLK